MRARNVTACNKMFLCFAKLADGFWSGFFRRGEPAPDKESKKSAFGKPLSCFAGLDVVGKLSSRPSRKVSLVSFSDAIRRTPAKCDENEGKMLPKETGSPKENQHSSRSSLSNNTTSNGVVNKGFNLSVLDLYSDGDTSHVGNEATPTDASAVSIGNKNAFLSETEANSEPVINSGNTDCAYPREESNWEMTCLNQTFCNKKAGRQHNKGYFDDPTTLNRYCTFACLFFFFYRIKH